MIYDPVSDLWSTLPLWGQTGVTDHEETSGTPIAKEVDQLPSVMSVLRTLMALVRRKVMQWQISTKESDDGDRWSVESQYEGDRRSDCNLANQWRTRNILWNDWCNCSIGKQKRDLLLDMEVIWPSFHLKIPLLGNVFVQGPPRRQFTNTQTMQSCRSGYQRSKAGPNKPTKLVTYPKK